MHVSCMKCNNWKKVHYVHISKFWLHLSDEADQLLSNKNKKQLYMSNVYLKYGTYVYTVVNFRRSTTSSCTGEKFLIVGNRLKNHVGFGGTTLILLAIKKLRQSLERQSGIWFLFSHSLIFFNRVVAGSDCWATFGIHLQILRIVESRRIQSSFRSIVLH